MKRLIAGLAGVVVIALGAGSAAAASYPAKPVRIVIPFTAGGITDIVGRLVAQTFSDDLGQRFYVENRPGAGGSLAADLVAHSPPDGYTLLMATAGTHAINPSVYRSLPYDHIKDFVPIGLISSDASFLLVRPSMPAKTLPEFIALLKQKPNTFNYATAGFGSSTHLAMELFKMKSETTMTVVAYKGASDVVQALMADQVDAAFNGLSTSLGPVHEGRLRALAISSRERSPMMPEIPTVAETLPGFEALAWNGLVAPAGVPAEVMTVLSQAIQRAMQQPKFVERMHQIDANAVGSTPAEFQKFIADETRKWAEVVRISGAKVE
jgi:tripartite-type tricarboxylate transporter receptor subunit TctC